MKKYVRNCEKTITQNEIQRELEELRLANEDPWADCTCVHCCPQLYHEFETIDHRKIASLFDEGDGLQIHITTENVTIEIHGTFIILLWDGFLKELHYESPY